MALEALQNVRETIAKVTAELDGTLMYKYDLVERWLCDVYGGVLGLTPRGLPLSGRWCLSFSAGYHFRVH